MNDLPRFSPRIAARRHQPGLALPVVLIFLLVITIVAVTAVRRTTLDEGITRNQLDYEIARQAAEAALRDAERDVMLPPGTPVSNVPPCSRGDFRPLSNLAVTAATFGPTCPQGQCKLTTAQYTASNYTTATSTTTGAVPWWPAAKGGLWGTNQNLASCTFNGAVPLGTFTGVAPITGVARQPEYLIEYFSRSQNTQRFVRLTASGYGADPATVVVLQSYFRFPDQ